MALFAILTDKKYLIELMFQGVKVSIYFVSPQRGSRLSQTLPTEYSIVEKKKRKKITSTRKVRDIVYFVKWDFY